MQQKHENIPRGLLCGITSDGTDDRVFLSLDAVGSSLNVSLGLRSLGLRLTSL